MRRTCSIFGGVATAAIIFARRSGGKSFAKRADSYLLPGGSVLLGCDEQQVVIVDQDLLTCILKQPSVCSTSASGAQCRRSSPRW